MTAKMTKVDPDALDQFAQQILRAAGLSEQEARHTAHSLSFAEMRGVPEYGFLNFAPYVRAVEEGSVANHVAVAVLQEGPAALVIDAKNGIGPSVCRQCMDLCIKHAKQYGCCFAAMRNANPPGLGAYQVRYAMESKCITLLVGNSGLDVPGLLPVVIGIPTGKGRPPAIWDTMLDVHSHSAAVLIDFICCVMGNPSNALELDSLPHKNEVCTGYFIGACDVEHFMTYEDYFQKAGQWFHEIKRAAHLEGHVSLPGEEEHDRFHKHKHDGLFIPSDLIETLQALGERFGIPVSF